MGFFQTNWRTQVTKILPPEMRSISMIDYITSLLWGLQTRMSANAGWEEEVRRRAHYNSQKIVLQDALNTIFSQPPNTIIVETTQSLAVQTFIYNESEGIDVFSYNESEGNPPLYLYNEVEVSGSFNFLVKVPFGIWTPELDRQIRAEVNLYKLAGKTYDVITY